MACPYFLPLRRVDESERWEHAPRLPLGDLYFGVCRARPGEVVEAEESVQRDLCNCGYARGRCDRFPGDAAAPDAVRFSVAGEKTGEVTGEINGHMRLVHITERDHAPASYGEAEFVVATGSFDDALTGDVLIAQGHAFVQSYLLRAAANTRS